MEFIKWWWAKRDTAEKFLMAVVLDIFIFAVCLPFFGLPVSAMIFFALFVVILLILIIYSSIAGLKSEIKKFKEEKDREAENIVQKLRGNFPAQNGSGPMTSAENILDQLRKRRGA